MIRSSVLMSASSIPGRATGSFRIEWPFGRSRRRVTSEDGFTAVQVRLMTIYDMVRVIYSACGLSHQEVPVQATDLQFPNFRLGPTADQHLDYPHSLVAGKTRNRQSVWLRVAR